MLMVAVNIVWIAFAIIGYLITKKKRFNVIAIGIIHFLFLIIMYAGQNFQYEKVINDYVTKNPDFLTEG